MLDNKTFLNKVLTSFQEFVSCGTSRSTAKLKPLHGAIAADIDERLGFQYRIYSQGYGKGKEAKIDGRYIDKMVDITIFDKRINKPVAGIGVKFVMQNYSQNSNNYFENMLGETANIRCANCPYFQIFIILDKLPYYKNSGELSKWEEFTHHNIKKYYELSKDNIDTFFHTPNKTLIYVVHIEPEIDRNTSTKKNYMDFYLRNIHNLAISNSQNQYNDFLSGGTVILNDYELFANKIYHTIKSK